MKRIEYSSEAGINKELALCYTIPDTFEENKQCYIGVNRNKKMFFTLFSQRITLPDALCVSFFKINQSIFQTKGV